MPKSDNQKLKILYILDYLQKNATDTNPVTAAELISMLRTHNISAERKSIYSDVAALKDFGIDILSRPGRKAAGILGCAILRSRRSSC